MEATRQSGNEQPNEMTQPYQGPGLNTPAETENDIEQSQNQIAETLEDGLGSSSHLDKLEATNIERDFPVPSASLPALDLQNPVVTENFSPKSS